MTQNIQVMDTIGTLPEFNPEEDWKVYKSRVQMYSLANNVEELRKVPVLLTTIGEKSLKLLHDFCDPSDPTSKSFDELITILDGHYTPRFSTYRKRIEFYNLTQEKDESISKWFVRVKNSTSFCNFGGNLEDFIKYKTVVGLNPGPILDRICEEDPSKSLKDTLKIVLDKEASISANSNHQVCNIQKKGECIHLSLRVNLKTIAVMGGTSS